MTRFLGLTGGVGSGKSTVASMFSSWGVPILDLDVVGQRVIAEQPLLLAQLVDAFGAAILDQDGCLNRQKLAALAFQSSAQTQRLNQLMHPMILRYEQAWRGEQSAPLAIVEASVLIEAAGVQRMDGLIVVFAEQGLRKQRVLQRGKQDETSFQQILQRQCTDKVREQWADYRLDNDASLRCLRHAVERLYVQLQT